ncbi:MAG: hypothetical protein ABIG70_04175 [Pseudomonadota bacterium]
MNHTHVIGVKIHTARYFFHADLMPGKYPPTVLQGKLPIARKACALLVLFLPGKKSGTRIAARSAPPTAKSCRGLHRLVLVVSDTHLAMSFDLMTHTVNVLAYTLSGFSES